MSVFFSIIMNTCCGDIITDEAKEWLKCGLKFYGVARKTEMNQTELGNTIFIVIF